MSMLKGNVKQLTLANTFFRRVISTTDEMQLVLMNLLPGEEIGLETHKDATQFFRVEAGSGAIDMDQGKGFKRIALKDDVFVMVPAGTPHNVINTSHYQNLKLYTIYSPPQHSVDRVDKVNPAEED